MDQHNFYELEDGDNDTLYELVLSALDEEIFPTQMHEGKNHNYTVDKDTNISESVRS